MSFAMAIVENALKMIEEKKLKKNENGRVNSITVLVGELLLINPEQLKFCFQAASNGTILEGSKLEIEIEPADISCINCGKKFESPIYLCDSCGGFVSVNGGKSFILKKIEIEN